MNATRFLMGVLLIATALDSWAQVPAQAATNSATAARVRGYLDPEERPDSLLLVPPPPAPGSAGYEADLVVYRDTARLRDTPRWRLAAADANVGFPHASGTFSCALGVSISQATMPTLYTLLQRTVVDAGQSTLAAKEKFRRERPFTVFDDPVCVPDDVAVLRKNGGYPSGHASAGWVWALLLTEVAPDRTDALLRRGYEFGQSRVVCGVHWQSDVDAARVVGAAVYARLHGEPEFNADVAAARAEVARTRAANAAAVPGCADEEKVIGLTTR